MANTENNAALYTLNAVEAASGGAGMSPNDLDPADTALDPQEGPAAGPGNKKPRHHQAPWDAPRYVEQPRLSTPATSSPSDGPIPHKLALTRITPPTRARDRKLIAGDK